MKRPRRAYGRGMWTATNARITPELEVGGVPRRGVAAHMGEQPPFWGRLELTRAPQNPVYDELPAAGNASCD